MAPHAALYRWDELGLEKITEMVARKVIAGAETTVTQAYFKKGTLVPIHVHRAERMVYVLQGAIRLQAAGQDTVVRDGEVMIVPAGVPHQAECLDDTFVLTVEPRR
jgi:quercetin dioxygenase-like cupin family protein